MRELLSWDELLMLGNRRSRTQTELQQETGCSCIHCDRHNIYLKYCIIYGPSSGGSHTVQASQYMSITVSNVLIAGGDTWCL